MDIDNHIVGKHAVFQLVEGRVCTLSDAARQLGLSYRQTRRWWKRYQLSAGSLLQFATPKRGGGWNKATAAMVQIVHSDHNALLNNDQYTVCQGVQLNCV